MEWLILEKRNSKKEILEANKYRKYNRLKLTDAINKLPDSPHKRFKYKHYTDLIYKTIFGKTSKELKQERGIENKRCIDFLNAEELELIADLENKVAVLIEFGISYNEIKEKIKDISQPLKNIAWLI